MLVYTQKKHDNLSVEPQTLLVFSAYLNTTQGKKLFYTEKFVDSNQLDRGKEQETRKSELIRSNNFLEDAIISLQKDQVYFYNKHNRKLQTLDLPDEVKNFEKNSLQLFVEELSDKEYLINFSHNQKEHFTYLFNQETSSLAHFKQFDQECDYIYCGGPAMLKKLSDDDFVFIQGAGDACWNAGVIHHFNLRTRMAKKLFEYGNGCFDRFDSYFGMFADNFIRAKHSILSSYTNSGGGPDQQLTEIYSTDLNGIKTVLIPNEKMPQGISYAKLNPENNTLYLNDDSSGYYQFSLKTNSLEKITKDQITEPKIRNENTDKGMRENNDFLTIEITEGNIGSIGSAYVSGQSINIKDSYGNRVPVLTDTFLDKVKFDKEEKKCPYEKSPVSLDYRKFPFRFSSHKYEDSARVLSSDEIIFVVVSECNEYPLENGRPSKLLLGAKQFMLNIRTGEVSLRGELDSKVVK